jgi:hypothetical protein
MLTPRLGTHALNRLYYTPFLLVKTPGEQFLGWRQNVSAFIVQSRPERVAVAAVSMFKAL